MTNQSEQVDQLATALVKAQAEMENATKNAKNPHFKSNYADLAEVREVTLPILNKHGLSVVQLPGFADGVVTLDTTLLHTSGQWIRGTAGAPIGRQVDAQGVGSATTYLRRYSLAALCGITQEDDDGNAASRRMEPQPKYVPEKEVLHHSRVIMRRPPSSRGSCGRGWRGSGRTRPRTPGLV